MSKLSPFLIGFDLRSSFPHSPLWKEFRTIWKSIDVSISVNGCLCLSASFCLPLSLSLSLSLSLFLCLSVYHIPFPHRSGQKCEGGRHFQRSQQTCSGS